MRSSRTCVIALGFCCLFFTSCSKSIVKGGEVHYKIKFEKQNNLVIATYDLGVKPAGPELISDFKIYVDAKNQIKEFNSGQTAFSSAAQVVLEHPEKDVNVGYVISTNQAWSAQDNGVLRGIKNFDDVEFSR